MYENEADVRQVNNTASPAPASRIARTVPWRQTPCDQHVSFHFHALPVTAIELRPLGYCNILLPFQLLGGMIRPASSAELESTVPSLLSKYSTLFCHNKPFSFDKKMGHSVIFLAYPFSLPPVSLFLSTC